MNPESVPGIAVATVGAIFTFNYTRDIYFALKSKRWPKTAGRVLEADIDFSSGGRYRAESARVGYAYEIRGVKYKSLRIDYAGRGSGLFARRFQGQYSEGQVIEVSYDPAKPSRSVLLTGVTFGNFFRLVCGLLVVLFGFAMHPAS